jgi:hypothetical protein
MPFTADEEQILSFTADLEELEGGSGASAAEIVAAINADATQTEARSNASLAAAQATIAATQSTTAATQATLAATEIGKVHRSANPVAAGAAMRRNKVAATSDTLDETLGAVP